MIIPPFKTMGKGRARFYCLAFIPVRYSELKTPATYGLYFCNHKRYTQFSFKTYSAQGELVASASGNEAHDNLESALFLAALGILGFLEAHPAMWRLFPKQNIPPRFRSPAYSRVRGQLCELLFTFRYHETAKRITKRMTSDLPKSPPLMICDKSAKPLALEDAPEDDQEFGKAIME
jgi:hypothetical protein